MTLLSSWCIININICNAPYGTAYKYPLYLSYSPLLTIIKAPSDWVRSLLIS